MKIVPLPETPMSREILARLMSLHPRSIDLSLQRLKRLLNRLGNPQNRLPPVVHVAGTNGKGSTISYMRAALEADGYRVHVYVSPHLVRFNERFRLAGSIIEDKKLYNVLKLCEEANAGEQITFFEITTAAAFVAFSEAPGDILLLETGLGGRLDATNVIDQPILTAITPISLDHQQFLGDHIRSIAHEKAGILKANVPAVIASQKRKAQEAIEKQANHIGAPLVLEGRDWKISGTPSGLLFEDACTVLELPPPSLAGIHQTENAGLAVACLLRLKGFKLSLNAIASGISNANWPGRLEKLATGNLAKILPSQSELWLDGGHNPAAGEVVANSLRHWISSRNQKQLHLIFGMLETKDPSGFLKPFVGLNPILWAVEIPNEPASLKASVSAASARKLGIKATAATGLQDALKKISKGLNSKSPQIVVICGSLYLAAHAIEENGGIPT